MIGAFLDSWPLFRDAWMGGWLLAVVLSMVGVVAVARDQIFLGAAVSQASMLGIALGMVAGAAAGAAGCSWCGADWVLMLWGGALAVAGALAPALLRRESHEAVTGWVFITGGSLAIVLLAHSPRGLEDIHRLMVSTIIGATFADVVVLALFAAVTVVTLARALPQIALLLLDGEMAAVLGVPVARWNLALSVWLGLTVGVSIRIAGVLFAFGCLVLPALAARNVCREVRGMFLVAPLVALASAVAAFVVAHHEDLPPGQVGAAVLAGVVVLSWVVRPFRRA